MFSVIQFFKRWGEAKINGVCYARVCVWGERHREWARDTESSRAPGGLEQGPLACAWQSPRRLTLLADGWVLSRRWVRVGAEWAALGRALAGAQSWEVQGVHTWRLTMALQMRQRGLQSLWRTCSLAPFHASTQNKDYRLWLLSQ